MFSQVFLQVFLEQACSRMRSCPMRRGPVQLKAVAADMGDESIGMGQAAHFLHRYFQSHIFFNDMHKSGFALGHYVYTPGAFHFSILLLFLLLPYFRTMRAVARSYWKAKQAFGSWRRVALVFKRWKRRQKDQRTEGR